MHSIYVPGSLADQPFPKSDLNTVADIRAKPFVLNEYVHSDR
jgi:hypothetical protein